MMSVLLIILGAAIIAPILFYMILPPKSSVFNIFRYNLQPHHAYMKLFLRVSPGCGLSKAVGISIVLLQTIPPPATARERFESRESINSSDTGSHYSA